MIMTTIEMKNQVIGKGEKCRHNVLSAAADPRPAGRVLHQ